MSASPNQGQWIQLPRHKGRDAISMVTYLEQNPRLFATRDTAAWFEAGAFVCRERTLQPDDLLQPGDQPRLFREPWIEPAVPRDFPTVHESASLLVVDKPAGLPITPTGDFYQHTLLHLLRDRTQNAALSPVHRLDIETSGLIAFAKHPEHRGFYQTLFQQNQVDKTYLALVFGHFPEGRRHIDTALGKDSLIYTKAVPAANGIAAKTEVLSVEYDPRHDMSLLSLKPITGRTNQLRAHCAGLGFPIVGDKKYGRDPHLFLQWLEDKNTNAHLSKWRLPYQALHSDTLALDTPDGPRLRLESQREVVQTWRDLLETSAK